MIGTPNRQRAGSWIRVEDLGHKLDPKHPELDGNVRWGIIGCGDVCEFKSGPALAKAVHSNLVAVMVRQLEEAEE